MINSGCERLLWVADANESRHLRCDPVRFLLVANEMTQRNVLPVTKPITVAPLPSATLARSIAGRYWAEAALAALSSREFARVGRTFFPLASARIIRRFSWGQQARADCSRAGRVRRGKAVACHL